MYREAAKSVRVDAKVILAGRCKSYFGGSMQMRGALVCVSKNCRK